jgi:preprotein translocase subunit SecA
MSILNSLIRQFFGTKSEKDIKEIQPLVNKIPEEYEKLKYLSNDQLRTLSN